jgi:hypothetical protein
MLKSNPTLAGITSSGGQVSSEDFARFYLFLHREEIMVSRRYFHSSGRDIVMRGNHSPTVIARKEGRKDILRCAYLSLATNNFDDKERTLISNYSTWAFPIMHADCTVLWKQQPGLAYISGIKDPGLERHG